MSLSKVAQNSPALSLSTECKLSQVQGVERSGYRRWALVGEER